MANGVIHWEIAGGDGEKLKSFYSNAFGWKVDSNNPMNYGLVAGQDGGIGGGISGVMPGDSARVTFYIASDDLEGHLKKIESLGGKTVMPPMDIPNMPLSLAQFSDPEGNIVGLVKGM